jgi:hypothetical protein
VARQNDELYNPSIIGQWLVASSLSINGCWLRNMFETGYKPLPHFAGDGLMLPWNSGNCWTFSRSLRTFFGFISTISVKLPEEIANVIVFRQKAARKQR